MQALVAVLGGTQSVHTNSYDEALALPSERSAALALRTQQILAHESGVADTADPLGGSFYVERLTADLEERARAYLDRIEDIGGSVAAIEVGFFQGEIEHEAYQHQQRVENSEEVVVGVNRWTETDEAPSDIRTVDTEDLAKRQTDRLEEWRANRDSTQVENALDALRSMATGEANVMPGIRAACSAGATVGEIADVFRDIAGTYRDPAVGRP